MTLLNTPADFLYNLQATSSVEARRLWRKSIKEKWNNKCAYCDSTENLTIDHVIPQCKGGIDFLTNVVCCCQSCNQDKGHKDWEKWYSEKEFFTHERKNAIIAWQKQFMSQNLVKYKPRKNNVY
jgi:5-methylcytosine-specific restriction endonuclease McrA